MTNYKDREWFRTMPSTESLQSMLQARSDCPPTGVRGQHLLAREHQLMRERLEMAIAIRELVAERDALAQALTAVGAALEQATNLDTIIDNMPVSRQKVLVAGISAVCNVPVNEEDV